MPAAVGAPAVLTPAAPTIRVGAAALGIGLAVAVTLAAGLFANLLTARHHAREGPA